MGGSCGEPARSEGVEREPLARRGGAADPSALPRDRERLKEEMRRARVFDD